MFAKPSVVSSVALLLVMLFAAACGSSSSTEDQMVQQDTAELDQSKADNSIQQDTTIGQDQPGPDLAVEDTQGDSVAVEDTQKDDSADSQTPDIADANVPDANLPDVQPDTTVDDTSPDLAGPDLFDATPDTSVADTNVPDTNVPDTNVPDTADSNVPDTNVPDTNVPDTNVPDTNVADTNVPDTAVTCEPALTNVGTDLLISEIHPVAPDSNGDPFKGGFIEFFNPTNSDINLGTTNYALCAAFTYLRLRSAYPNVTVPAGGYAVVAFPLLFSSISGDNPNGGEIILYKNISNPPSDNTQFESNANLVDFICWGTNPHSSRRNQAISAGVWDTSPNEDCAGVLTGDSIKRLTNTAGTNKDHYDVSSSPTPSSCVP